jgi:hypothetical protein
MNGLCSATPTRCRKRNGEWTQKRGRS